MRARLTKNVHSSANKARKETCESEAKRREKKRKKNKRHAKFTKTPNNVTVINSLHFYGA